MEERGSFGVFDIMRVGSGDFDFPVPWAADESMSLVRDVPAYQSMLKAAGFEVSHVRDRGEFAEEFFAGPKAKRRNSMVLLRLVCISFLARMLQANLRT